jgi:hypothetical protein
MVGGVAQVIKSLPHKYKALSSNPSTKTNKQNSHKVVYLISIFMSVIIKLLKLKKGKEAKISQKIVQRDGK